MLQQLSMSDPQPTNNFSLMGASRVGISLAYHLNRIGYRPEFVWNRRPERLALARQYVPFVNFSTEFEHGCRNRMDWIIIAVTDDAVEEVAARIAECGIDFQAVNIFHTSGCLNSQALNKLKQKGALTGSLHPVVSVPDVPTGLKLLGHCNYTCEGEIKNTLAELVSTIGGQPFILNRRQKEIVHVAAVFMNNYVVALINALKKLGAENTIPPEKLRAVLEPISQQAISSGWGKNIAEALTGPLIRGDYQTIDKHLQLLENYPELKRLYQVFIDLARQVLAEPPL